MSYLFLVGAIAAEVFSTSLLKSTEGFSRLWPSVAVGLGYLLSFVLLAQAVKNIPVSVAYAVWSGLGTATIAAIGAAFLGEPLGWVKVTGIGLIIGGVVILNLGGGH
ncbi:DMT family transporter [Jidongwangia harbinensis]|uniref:DMT family transporter n=1 Tax=Jidongwangia harbinensis TaxID=2878561 RepID=UPI001CD94700|nr:multidrug efflux SMR transporter [Jidongwangia harbinensis]MCA2216719.1 multidrug efflux SMR transporter [Jidongwangia harbinensis]